MHGPQNVKYVLRLRDIHRDNFAFTSHIIPWILSPLIGHLIVRYSEISQEPAAYINVLDRFVWNISTVMPDYTASRLRRR
jgi:hypothetical protein